jgi:hypothetical protein
MYYCRHLLIRPCSSIQLLTAYSLRIKEIHQYQLALYLGLIYCPRLVRLPCDHGYSSSLRVWLCLQGRSNARLINPDDHRVADDRHAPCVGNPDHLRRGRLVGTYVKLPVCHPLRRKILLRSLAVRSSGHAIELDLSCHAALLRQCGSLCSLRPSLLSNFSKRRYSVPLPHLVFHCKSNLTNEYILLSPHIRFKKNVIWNVLGKFAVRPQPQRMPLPQRFLPLAGKK